MDEACTPSLPKTSPGAGHPCSLLLSAKPHSPFIPQEVGTSINKGGAAPASQDQALAPPQPGCCPNHGNVRKAVHTLPQMGMHTQRHVPCGDVPHACIHRHMYIQVYTHMPPRRDVHTQGPAHTGHAQACFGGGGVGGSDVQPDACARRTNPLSCSSWTH